MKEVVFRSTPACRKACLPCNVRCATIMAVQEQEWSAIDEAWYHPEPVRRAADLRAATDRWAIAAQAASLVQPAEADDPSPSASPRTFVPARLLEAARPPG